MVGPGWIVELKKLLLILVVPAAVGFTESMLGEGCQTKRMVGLGVVKIAERSICSWCFVAENVVNL